MNHDTMNPKTIPVSSKVNFLKQIFFSKNLKFYLFQSIRKLLTYCQREQLKHLEK